MIEPSQNWAVACPFCLNTDSQKGLVWVRGWGDPGIYCFSCQSHADHWTMVNIKTGEKIIPDERYK